MTTSRQGQKWTWEESLIAFRLYCILPFGQLHQSNPQITQLANLLQRSPSSIAMKACNFASLDPTQQARGIKGLSNRGKFEQQIWDQFHEDSQGIADQAEQNYENLLSNLSLTNMSEIPEPPAGPTEQTRTVKVRRVQKFFRTAVLISYNNKCAISGINISSLIHASHIIPWADSESRRADPRNGIALNTFYHAAFDAGHIAFDHQYHILLSEQLMNATTDPAHLQTLNQLQGRPLILPQRFLPDPQAITYHRENIFKTA